MYYEVTTTYQQPICEGSDKIKSHRDKFLCEALTFTDCEATTIRALSAMGAKDIDMTAAARTRIAEVVDDGKGERYYRCKVSQPFVDDKGKEKRTTWYMMFTADSNAEALAKLEQHLKQGYEGFEVDDVVLTQIKGVM